MNACPEPVTIEPVPARPTVRQAVKAWLEFFSPTRKATSQASMKAMMNPFAKYWPRNRLIETLTIDDIADWQNHCLTKREMRGRTVLARHYQLRRFFRWAVEEGYIERNPVQIGRLPMIQREIVHKVPFTFEEFSRLLAVIPPEDKYNLAHACQIAFYTGLRCIDVAHLSWNLDDEGHGSRVDFTDDTLIVWPKKLSKICQKLVVPMDPEVKTLLFTLYQARYKTNSPYVLPWFHGYYVGARKQLIEQVRDACDAAGLPEHSFHSFRHGFVTRLINCGIDPIIIGSMTGQTREQIVAYAHVSTERKVVALDAAREAMYQTRTALTV